MKYADFLKTLKNRKFQIDGKVLSLDQLKEWVSESSTNKIELQVKEVYREFLFSEKNYIEVFTSGSTGIPKLIKHTKEKVFHSALMSNSFFKLDEAHKVLLVLPPDKIGGKMLIIRSIVGGMDLHYIKPELNPLKDKEINPFDFCSLTPAQLASIIQDDGAITQLRKINKILLGGSDIDAHLIKFIEAEINSYFFSYGMTETISHVAVRRLNGSQSSQWFEALPGVSFSTKLDSNQLIIHAPMILEEDLICNDLVKLQGNKKLIWLGRKDNIVNSGGIKLIVEHIEQKLKNEIKEDFYFIGEKDPVLGERLVMVIQSTSNKEKMIQKLLSTKLSKFELPKKIYSVDKIQYTANGKIKRIIPSEL